MGKFLKIVVGFILFLILASLAAIIVVTQLVNPNDYRNQIERFMYSQTGRSFDIQGEIEWSFFPKLGITLPEVTIGNPKGIEGPALAHIEKVSLQARLVSLLVGKIDIDEIQLDNAKINLIAEKDKSNNWQQWHVRNQPNLTFYAALGNPSHPIQSVKQSALPIRALSIRNFSLRNSRLLLIDRSHDRTYEFRNVDLTLHGFKDDRDFPIQFAYELVLKQSNAALQQRLNATAHIKLAERLITLPEFSVTSFWVRPELGKLPIDLEGKLIADLKHQRGSISNLSLQIANLTLTGDASVQTHAGHAELKADLKSKDTALNPLLTALTGNSRLSGKLDWQTSLTCDLNAPSSVLNTLSGQGQFNLREGELNGINLVNLMQQAIAFTGNGAKAPLMENVPTVTQFDNIRGTYWIRQGVLENNDLIIEFKPYLAKGAGTLNLVDDRLNYQLTLLSNNTTNNDKSVALPILISGTLDQPSIRPDFSKIAGQFFKKELNNFLTNPGHNLKNTLKNLLP